MSDDPFSINPLYNAWLKAQGQMLEAQAPFWEQMSGAMSSSGTGDMNAVTEQLWSEARKQGQDWVNRIGARVGFSSAEGGIAQETLQRMMDPGQFLFAGSDEINQTIQKLVEGPEFADIGTLERQGLKTTREWLALREASTEYRMVTAKAWGRAFERFSKEAATDLEAQKSGPRALMNRWLDIANDELIASQRTGEFLAAQRKMLRAGIDYRLREREMVEAWCETHSIPTRTEVDDLHEMVHRLRRELRNLKKTVAAQQTPSARKAPRKKPAAKPATGGSND
jgi:hypothetical protein